MNAASIVILSKNPGNLKACLAHLATNAPGLRVIVVSDGIPAADLKELGGIDRVVQGIQPFVFARNANLGVDAAGSDDVILLNDDALLKTAGGFLYLSEIAQSEPGARYGVISALISYGGACAPDQCRGAYRYSNEIGLRETRHHMLAFVAVYIRREILDQVGRLDESFIGYGYDDDDYCMRVKFSGWRLGVFDGCYVEHGYQTTGLPSSFRDRGNAGPPKLDQNRKIFNAKWGVGI